MKRLILLLLVPLLAGCASARTPAPSPVATQAATAAPVPAPAPWWRQAVFYELFVRSFQDTNGDGIGDFSGVTSRLDYLQQLGVNALWLMPINPSPSYHGYDVTNYYSVNPEYGTLADFRHLLAQAHRRGMHVIIDLVLNHTSRQHPFFVDALKGPASPYYDYYVSSDSSSGQYWHPLQGDPSRFYFGLFCDCMPDLNYRNPAVTAQMENAAAYWLDQVGVDGFRLDAMKHLVEEGAQVQNTPSTHAWLRGFHEVYKAHKPDAYVVGEAFGADPSLDKSYEGDQVDQAFNFELAADFIGSANTGSSSGVVSGMTFALQALPDGNYATFLTNHDQDRAMSELGGSVDKARLAAFLLLTAPGTPYIYYGEEIGMQGEKPDEDIRLPMQWDASANAGFTTGQPWRAPRSDYATVNVAVESKDAASLLSAYHALLSIRREHAALSTGETALLDTGSPAVYAVLRSSAEESLLVLANLGDQPVADYSLGLARPQANLPAGTFGITALYGSGKFDGLTIGADRTLAHYKPLAALPPHAMYVLKIDLP